MHERVTGIFARIADCGELLGQIGKTMTTEDRKIKRIKLWRGKISGVRQSVDKNEGLDF